MKTRTAALALVLALAAAGFAGTQAGANPDGEKEAAIATALDYSDGAYSGDGARMERAISPDLNKLIFGRRSPAEAMQARYSSVSNLVETIRLVPDKVPAEKRRTDAAVLEMTDDVACVRLKSAYWCDYLQEVKSAGRWKIVNVLWTQGLDTPAEKRFYPSFDPEKERPAVAAAILDLLTGLVSGDMGRLERAIHPETCLAVYMVAPDNRAAVIDRMRWSALREMARARLVASADPGAPGAPPAPAAPTASDVRIIDLMDGMAFAAAKIPAGTIYLQMQLLDGSWKAVNGLIRPTRNEIVMRPSQKPAPASK